MEQGRDAPELNSVQIIEFTRTLKRLAVDSGAIGGTQIDQYDVLPVDVQLGMSARHRGVFDKKIAFGLASEHAGLLQGNTLGFSSNVELKAWHDERQSLQSGFWCTELKL